MKGLFTLLILGFSFVISAQDCIAEWITIDDATNKKKSKVQLFKYEGKMYGKITYLYPREGREPHPKCVKCVGKLKDQPIEGMLIVNGLEWDGKEWKNGTIVDPESGKIYNVKMWLDPSDSNKLNVRGYIGFFYRTQTWQRVTKVK